MCYVTGWYMGKKRAMKFAVPRIWLQPTDHSSNCYFCMVDPTNSGFSYRPGGADRPRAPPSCTLAPPRVQTRPSVWVAKMNFSSFLIQIDNANDISAG